MSGYVLAFIVNFWPKTHKEKSLFWILEQFDVEKSLNLLYKKI